MQFLVNLINKKPIKGFKYRLSNLENLMDTAQGKINELYHKIETLQYEEPVPHETIKKLEDEKATWQRMYDDAYARHDEVESALLYLTKKYK